MQLNAATIRDLRLQHGWTQQQLADICDLSLRTIQRVELHGIASLETCKALAGAFDIERSKLELPAETAPDQAVVTRTVPWWWLTATFLCGVGVGMLVLKLVS